VSGNSESTPLTLFATGDLLLGDADIDVFHDSGPSTVRLQAGGDIDFGTADLFFDSTSNTTTATIITAGGSIISQGSNVIEVDGNPQITAGEAIALRSVDLDVKSTNTNGASLQMNATGEIDLTGSQVLVNGATTIQSAGNIKLDDVNLVSN